MVDIPAYLARILYAGPTQANAETLRALHRAHLVAVPFENLDIHLGLKITIDEAAILNKVVVLRRGGFCYELNGAFAALLRALGFQVTLLSARVARANGDEGPEFDNLTLRVDLNEPWLADVGFGESFLEPLLLEAGKDQRDPTGKYRLLAQGECLRIEKFSCRPQYSFSLQPRRLEEFAGMCRYHQTSPESSFTQKRICSRATSDDRITLSEMKLITTSEGAREERSLSSEKEWNSTLREKFGIRL
jgi:N-hydroxyarylamine O-acetyltransferase